MPAFPSIPIPTQEPKALLETVLALKQAVEMLTGQDMSQKFANHVFVDHVPPVAIHRGDLWLCEGERFSLNIWNGERWILVVDIVMPASLREHPDLLLDTFRRNRR